MSEDYLYRIELPYACYGITIRDNVCIEAAPIAKWMVDKELAIIRDWIISKHGKLEMVKPLRSK